MFGFKRKAYWIYWREDGNKRCKCSACKTSYGCMDTPYCPNCGKKCMLSWKMCSFSLIRAEDIKGRYGKYFENDKF